MLLSSQPNDFNRRESGSVRGPETLKQRCRRVFEFELGNSMTPENWQQVELQLGMVAEDFELARSNEMQAMQGGASILVSEDLQQARLGLEEARARMLEKLHLAEDLCQVFMRPEKAKEQMLLFQRIAWSMPNPKA